MTEERRVEAVQAEIAAWPEWKRDLLPDAVRQWIGDKQSVGVLEVWVAYLPDNEYAIGTTESEAVERLVENIDVNCSIFTLKLNVRIPEYRQAEVNVDVPTGKSAEILCLHEGE
jgi:hypothetical protein